MSLTPPTPREGRLTLEDITTALHYASEGRANWQGIKPDLLGNQLNRVLGRAAGQTSGEALIAERDRDWCDALADKDIIAGAHSVRGGAISIRFDLDLALTPAELERIEKFCSCTGFPKDAHGPHCYAARARWLLEDALRARAVRAALGQTKGTQDLIARIQGLDVKGTVHGPGFTYVEVPVMMRDEIVEGLK